MGWAWGYVGYAVGQKLRIMGWTSRRSSIVWFVWITICTQPMRISNDALDVSHHLTRLWFTGMNNAWSVNLICLSAVQVIPVTRITTWLLGTSEGKDETS